ncbi:hypothetical protein PBY51_000900 [Eleginops maclovinus]|uniref:Uncharacterized protein n=1 Tax=Eleginops maclovinus TaxID=56733 RepID=A0AAN7XIE5_ELEMC|nr:hypothetical protein PBY51_000900 [Eleginops maclovinus]
MRIKTKKTSWLSLFVKSGVLDLEKNTFASRGIVKAEEQGFEVRVNLQDSCKKTNDINQCKLKSDIWTFD